MKSRSLGRTELQVSELCLGTLNFGWTIPESAAFELLDAFRAAGGNFIQAACLDPDAGPVSAAWSEELTGRWLRARAVHRHEFVLSTRVVIGRTGRIGYHGLADSLRRSCEDSLRRLRISCLDLVLLEWNAALPPTDEILFALSELKRAGLVRHLGASGFPAWRLMEAIHRASLRNTNRFEVIQADYSLVDRGRVQDDTFSLCRDYRAGFLARSPLAGGFLAGRAPGPVSSARSRRLHARHATPFGAATVAALAEIAAERGATRAQVALAWVLAQPAVTASVVGVHTPAQLRDLAAATEIALTPDELARLTHPFDQSETNHPASSLLEPVSAS